MFSKLKKLFKGAHLPSHKPEPGNNAQAQDSGTAPLKSDINHQRKDLPVAMAAEKKLSKHPLPELKRNRKGIRVIDKHLDMIELFPVEDMVNDAISEIHPVPVLPEKTEQKTVKERLFKPATRITRNGFPILDDLDDFSLFMDKQPVLLKEAEDTLSDASHAGIKQDKRHSLTNKHGIPMLPDGESWNSEDTRSEIEKNEFMRMLNESLGGKTRDVLMNEKGVRTVRKKPLSLKEKVKRYPLPQSQLDLHGYTAIKAELRAETFLKNAYGNQLHTVIIIVGKGLHSDEGAVLPGVIETLLIRLRKDGIVLYYDWENEKKVRSGSVSVYLSNMVFD